MMEECEKHGHIAANQVGYHMFDRRMESEVLPYCKENNIGLDTFLNKLNGIFSFAIWDTIDSQLFLARDSFGVKPLY